MIDFHGCEFGAAGKSLITSGCRKINRLWLSVRLLKIVYQLLRLSLISLIMPHLGKILLIFLNYWFGALEISSLIRVNLG